jgi:hypothetical protein
MCLVTDGGTWTREDLDELRIRRKKSAFYAPFCPILI